MRIKYIFTLMTIALMGLTACENDGFYYQDQPRVRLVGDNNWTLGTDSLEVSFLTVVGEEAHINVDACVMGNVSDKDRIANIVVDNTLTTADASLYSVPSTVTIPAGQNKGTFQVTLRKNQSLQNTTVRLYVKVAESADFNVGVREWDHLLLKWNDILSKPTFWAEISEFFGEYSVVKYRFMLQVLAEQGFNTDLNPSTGLNWSDYHNYNIIFANALTEYNSSHSTPLVDENGAMVSF